MRLGEEYISTGGWNPQQTITLTTVSLWPWIWTLTRSHGISERQEKGHTVGHLRPVAGA